MRIVVDGLPYPVVVSDDAAVEVAALVSRTAECAVLVADDAVAAGGEAVAALLRGAGIDLRACQAIKAGEHHKRWRSVAALHDAWIKAGVERGCIAVAVGGGTLTDVVGFAAATYMRGIRWLPVATTLLAMVDAAIGGKTGVDLPQGKNLIGALWHPVGVVADLQALDTLGKRQRGEGVAEAVKAAVVGDPSLLDDLEHAALEGGGSSWGDIVAKAARVKVEVVARDPDDRDGRAVLNLGHTFAHGFERASRYRMTHGAAVALGLRAAGILARERTGWAYADHRRVLRVLRRFGLAIQSRRLTEGAVLDAMRLDKKRRAGRLRFVLPVRLGEVRTGVEIPDDEVVHVLEELRHSPRAGAF